ncbi:MAG: penicillin-insensitive murein endopeptidase [Hyphomicrobiales bacterium]
MDFMWASVKVVKQIISVAILGMLAFAVDTMPASAKKDELGNFIQQNVLPRKKPLRTKAKPSQGNIAARAKRIPTKVPAKNLFGAKKDAANLKPRAIGYYTRGCLAGAEEVPVTGSAWQAMRLSRNRNWGHPKLVALVKRLAVEARKYDGYPGLLVGDLSQPRGGPMTSGHRSHQMGLDADIWLTPMPKHVMSRKEREKKKPILMTVNRKKLNRKNWTEAHARLLKRVVSYSEVARIFVHPPIKREMCNWATRKGFKDRRWLGKIRAYYGHNYHFHIRIKCPKGSVGCKDQKAAPNRDDCKENLAYWMSNKPWGGPVKKKKTTKKKKAKKKARKPRHMTIKGLPNACRTVLVAN